MAGNYPNVPGNRMILDRDGSQGYRISDTNVITPLSQEEMRVLSDETPAGVSLGITNGTARLVVIFPELRHVAGYFLGKFPLADDTTLTSAEVSSNSTNGLDGTWQQVTKKFNTTISINPGHRTLINPIDAVNVKAVRFTILFAAGGYAPYEQVYVHLYGAPAAGALNRLAIWHPSLNQRIGGSDLDWGDAPRSSSANRTFRVKNLSATLTAASPLLGFDALTDTIPSVAGQHTLSLDGSNFFSQVTLPALAPGAISNVVTVRRVTPADAALSLWDVRMIATASSWT